MTSRKHLKQAILQILYYFLIVFVLMRVSLTCFLGKFSLMFRLFLNLVLIVGVFLQRTQTLRTLIHNEDVGKFWRNFYLNSIMLRVAYDTWINKKTWIIFWLSWKLSSHSQVLWRVAVLENFSKFTREFQWWRSKGPLKDSIAGFLL